MPFVWETKPTDVFPPGYQLYLKVVMLTLGDILARRGREMEAYAKANHPWRNRTGAAEAGLAVTVDHPDQAGSMAGMFIVAIITLAHGVDYGIYLETRFGGSLAVIAPTLDRYGPLFMNDVRAVISGPLTISQVNP